MSMAGRKKSVYEDVLDAKKGADSAVLRALSAGFEFGKWEMLCFILDHYSITAYDPDTLPGGTFMESVPWAYSLLDKDDAGVAQRTEHGASTPGVEGSTPSIRANCPDGEKCRRNCEEGRECRRIIPSNQYHSGSLDGECPDGGHCNHTCHEKDCFRVEFCSPLSSAGDTWEEVLKKYELPAVVYGMAEQINFRHGPQCDRITR